MSRRVTAMEIWNALRRCSAVHAERLPRAARCEARPSGPWRHRGSLRRGRSWVSRAPHRSMTASRALIDPSRTAARRSICREPDAVVARERDQVVRQRAMNRPRRGSTLTGRSQSADIKHCGGAQRRGRRDPKGQPRRSHGTTASVCRRSSAADDLRIACVGVGQQLGGVERPCGQVGIARMPGDYVCGQRTGRSAARLRSNAHGRASSSSASFSVAARRRSVSARQQIDQRGQDPRRGRHARRAASAGDGGR